MSSVRILTELQQKLGLTMYGLGKQLGLKSSAHGWLFIKGGITPSVATCHKIIKLGKKAGMNITLDMLLGDTEKK